MDKGSEILIVDPKENFLLILRSLKSDICVKNYTFWKIAHFLETNFSYPAYIFLRV